METLLPRTIAGFPGDHTPAAGRVNPLFRVSRTRRTRCACSGRAHRRPTLGSVRVPHLAHRACLSAPLHPGLPSRGGILSDLGLSFS